MSSQSFSAVAIKRVLIILLVCEHNFVVPFSLIKTKPDDYELDLQQLNYQEPSVPRDLKLCEKPSCSITQIETLWPSKYSPMLFYRCMKNINDVWTLRVLFCTNDTYFSFPNQQCVELQNWKDVCPDETSPTDSSTQSTTTAHSSSEATTEWLSQEDIEGTTLEVIEIPDITTTEKVSSSLPASTYLSTESTITTETNESSIEHSTETSTTVEVIPEQPVFKLCEEPICTRRNAFSFWPHREPEMYYRCIPGSGANWTWRIYWCPSGLFFNFFEQNCVEFETWQDACADANEN